MPQPTGNRLDHLSRRIQGATQGLADKDRERSVDAERERGERSLAGLADIRRRSRDTRDLVPAHVHALAESIAVLGLIEPIAVDRSQRLLAGAHRLAALRQLQEEQPERFGVLFPGGQVPVRVLPFSAEREPDQALAVEVAENEHRRDYSRVEVASLAERLKEAGYVDRPGRPKAQEKALKPALAVILGKSLRTVERMLRSPDAPGPGTGEGGSGAGETLTDVRVSRSRAQAVGTVLKQLGGAVERALTALPEDEDGLVEVRRALQSLADRISTALSRSAQGQEG